MATDVVESRGGLHESASRRANRGDLVFRVVSSGAGILLLAIMAAIAVFRASGALDAVQHLISPVTSLVGIPVEVVPIALLKPLSGSGALAIMADTMKTYGPDSLVGYMVSVMNGSTETTFYVLAVYFGSVQVRAVRHTLAACLVADTVGLISAVYLTRLFFG